MSATLAKKNCLKMNVTLHFQYNFNFFLPTLPSINTSTFLLHNFQCNFKFVFFLDSLVKVLRLMIISFHSLIYVQLAKTTLILKQKEYFFFKNLCNQCIENWNIWYFYGIIYSWVLLIIVLKAVVKEVKNSMFALVSTTFWLLKS